MQITRNKFFKVLVAIASESDEVQVAARIYAEGKGVS